MAAAGRMGQRQSRVAVTGAESASPGFFHFTSAIQMLPLASTLLNIRFCPCQLGAPGGSDPLAARHLGLPSHVPEPRPARAPPRHLDLTKDQAPEAPEFDAAR